MWPETTLPLDKNEITHRNRRKIQYCPESMSIETDGEVKMHRQLQGQYTEWQSYKHLAGSFSLALTIFPNKVQ